MDNGVYPKSYFDYESLEMAIQREEDIAAVWVEQYDEATPYSDPFFPADSRALYFDPLYPPKGALPADALNWCRIHKHEIIGCEAPVTIVGDKDSVLIEQGALGDSHFINALRVVACETEWLRRLLVSDKYASMGLYTFRFNKAGKWRYVHIDDRIPCRQSGRVHFCRNVNPNETFAMLLEKAYAKIHGCYESLVHGMMECTIRDLTPAAHVGTIRTDSLPSDGAYSSMWVALEDAMEENRLVACGRFVADPYSEKVEDRKGIDLSLPYQVLDVCSAKSMPSENLDAIQVAMVCVRLLQPRGGGLFDGRWSRGHALWSDYPDIAKDLCTRTDEVLVQKKLIEPKPDKEQEEKEKKEKEKANKVKEEAKIQLAQIDADGNDIKMDDGAEKKEGMEEEEDEDDDILNKKVDGADAIIPDDPFEGVEIPYLSEGEEEPDNLSLNMRRKVKSKVVEPEHDFVFWIQFEDFINVFNRVFIVEDLSSKEKMTSKRFMSKWVLGDFIGGSGGPPRDLGAQLNDGAATGMELLTAEDVANYYANLANQGQESESDSDEEEEVNTDPFTDNPMYPFSLTEPARISITLFQADRRWSTARMDGDPLTMCVSDFATRGGRSRACMEYPYAIGFVLLKLYGLKMRVTTFRPRKLVGSSIGIVHLNCSSNVFDLLPGRYAIVPFTHIMLPRSIEYAIYVQYKTGSLDFEVEDLLKERPVDDIVSDDELDAKPAVESTVARPTIVLPTEAPLERWSWEEDFEEMSIMTVYEQVGDLARSLKLAKNEISKLKYQLEAVRKDQLRVAYEVNILMEKKRAQENELPTTTRKGRTKK